MVGTPMNEVSSALQLSPPESQRIGRLLDRGGALAMELERLDSLGIFPLTRADEEYPQRYRKRLAYAPPVLFCAGDERLLRQPGIAVVGSRSLGPEGEDIARKLGEACAASEVVLVSGGARGTDAYGMRAALEYGGKVVGVLADSLMKIIRQSDNRGAIETGRLCFITQYHPDTPFSVGTAMGRNALIYALSDHAVVVSSDVGKGGTWEGAKQAMEKNLAPVHVVQYDAMPEGNRELIRRGAKPLAVPFGFELWKLKDSLDEIVACDLIPPENIKAETISSLSAEQVQPYLIPPGPNEVPAKPKRKRTPRKKKGDPI